METIEMGVSGHTRADTSSPASNTDNDEGYQPSLSSKSTSSVSLDVTSCQENIVNNQNEATRGKVGFNRGHSVIPFLESGSEAGHKDDKEKLYFRRIKVLCYLTIFLTCLVILTAAALVVLYTMIFKPVKQEMKNSGPPTEIVNGSLCNYRPQAGQHVGTSVNNCSYFGTGERPAAHLVIKGSHASRTHHGPEGIELTQWLHDTDKAFLNGIECRNGRLVILKTGNYFIYSQVFFIQTFARVMSAGSAASTTSNNDPKRVWHAIYRYHEDHPNNEEDVLLKSTRSKHWVKDQEFWLYSSYLGAVSRLREGDELFIKVSNITLLSPNTASTFFGAYMI